MQRKWMNWLFNPCLIVGVQLSAGIMGASLTGTALAQVPQNKPTPSTFQCRAWKPRVHRTGIEDHRKRYRLYLWLRSLLEWQPATDDLYLKHEIDRCDHGRRSGVARNGLGDRGQSHFGRHIERRLF